MYESKLLFDSLAYSRLAMPANASALLLKVATSREASRVVPTALTTLLDEMLSDPSPLDLSLVLSLNWPYGTPVRLS